MTVLLPLQLHAFGHSDRVGWGWDAEAGKAESWETGGPGVGEAFGVMSWWGEADCGSWDIEGARREAARKTDGGKTERMLAAGVREYGGKA